MRNKYTNLINYYLLPVSVSKHTSIYRCQLMSYTLRPPHMLYNADTHCPFQCEQIRRIFRLSIPSTSPLMKMSKLHAFCSISSRVIEDTPPPVQSPHWLQKSLWRVQLESTSDTYKRDLQQSPGALSWTPSTIHHTDKQTPRDETQDTRKHQRACSLLRVTKVNLKFFLNMRGSWCDWFL